MTSTDQPQFDRTGFADEYPFESHFLDRDGLKLHYVDEGEGETLLFVHGNPTWSFAFRNMIKDFSQNYRCIALDNMGCGFSDKPQDYPYNLNQHVENLIALIEELDLQKVTLVAHDWGGGIAMGAAVRRPDRIARFVLSNTAAFLSTRIPKSIHLVHIPGLGALMVRGFNAFVKFALTWTVVNKSKMTPAIKAGYSAPYKNWHDRVAVLRFVQDIPLKPSHISYDTLKEIQDGLPQFADHPIQFIWGEQDFCFTMKFLEEFQEFYPKANSFTLPHAGHYVFEDADEEVRECIRKFLNANPLS